MKVGCEMACRDAFGDERALILRLQRSASMRTTVLCSWLSRMRCAARSSSCARPGHQLIDVRDVACFLLDLPQRDWRPNVVLHEDRSYGSLVRACADVVAPGRGRSLRARLGRRRLAPREFGSDDAAVAQRCSPMGCERRVCAGRWAQVPATHRHSGRHVALASTGDRNVAHPRSAAYGSTRNAGGSHRAVAHHRPVVPTSSICWPANGQLSSC
jgi:hypothetical protein